MKNEWKSAGFLVAILSLAFVILLIIPIFGVLLRFNIENAILMIQRTDFVPVFFQSVVLSLCVSAISVSIALIVSFLIREQSTSMQKFLIMCFTMPILIPTISMGMGIMHLFSRNGLVYQLLGLRVNIFGFNGLLLGMVLNIAPLAILQIYDVLRYEDKHLHDEAKALRLDAASRMYILSLPRVKSAIKRAFFATFLFSFTDFGINLMVGGRFRTLSITLYQEIIGRMNFDRAAAISISMWIPLIILYFFCMRKSIYTFGHNVKGTTSSLYLKNRGKVISCVILIVAALVFLLPITTFILSSLRPTDAHNPDIWQNYRALFQSNLTRYLRNSLIIAVSVSAFGTIFSCLTAYVTSKVNILPSRVMKLIATIPFSVPGLLIGLGFVISYISLSNLFNTFVPMIGAILINFFGIPYFMFLNNFSLMSNEIEISAKVFRISRFNTFLRVYLPQMKQTIAESMMFYFVNSMITISTVVVLFRARTMPLSILITQFEGQLMIFRAAAATTIIVFINIIVKLAFYLLNRRS